MNESNIIDLKSRVKADEPITVLDALLREGARKMLQSAIENEVEEYVASRAGEVGADGRRVVVRNGHLPERELVTGVGPVKVKQPRVRDRSGAEKFTSQILPPFLRRVPSIDALIPGLYLKGVSTGDFSEALSAILGSRTSRD